MASIDFDQVKEWLEENEDSVPDFVKDALTSSKLRTVIAEKDAEINRLKPFEAKVEKLEKAPKLKDAFKQAGVDYDSLTRAEKRTVDEFDGDLADVELIAAYASEWELPTSEVAEEAEEPAAAAVVGHAQASKGIPQRKSLQEQIAEAEANGDFKLSGRLKTASLRPAGLSADSV